MQQSVGRIALALALMGMPSVATGQHEMSMGHMQKHEVGVDITGFYQRLSLNGLSSNQILIGTPVDLRRIIDIKKPTVRVRYELQEIGEPTLGDILEGFLKKYPKRGGKK